MCRPGSSCNCGTLVSSGKCSKCRLLAGFVKFANRLHPSHPIRFRELTIVELNFYGSPFFECDESGVLVGLRPVTKRLFQELFMPAEWKARNFTAEKTVALARRAHDKKCWHVNPPRPLPSPDAKPLQPCSPAERRPLVFAAAASFSEQEEDRMARESAIFTPFAVD